MIELIAVHIPKTAGTSFYRVLLSAYGYKHVHRINHRRLKNSGEVLTDILPPAAKVLNGHLPIDFLPEHFVNGKIPIITWLRDPVERVISNYYFRMHQIKSGRRQGKERLLGESLLEYANRPGMKNPMTKYFGEMPAEDFFFIGITKYFPQDLQDVSKLLGWKKVVIPSYKKMNTRFKKRFVPPDIRVRAKIAELNQLDIALYEKALLLRSKRREYVEQTFNKRKIDDLACLFSKIRQYIFSHCTS